MSPSAQSEDLKRTGTILRKGVSSQVSDYSKRFSSVDGLHDDFLEEIIRTDFDKDVPGFTERFFDDNRVRFAAVDGSAYTNTMFDLVVFFGGSYAVEGNIDFRGGSTEVVYDSRIMEGGVGLSSCVPMYVNQVVEVDQTFIEVGEDGRLSAERVFGDEEVVNNSTIANSLMAFSEFYLAYRLASSEKPPRVILLDRSLSSMYGSLMYDTRKTNAWDISVLIGYGDPVIDEVDILYNRYRAVNRGLDIPPARGDMLRYCLVYLLEEEGPLELDEVFCLLNIDSDARESRAEGFLDRAVEEGYLARSGEAYRVDERYEASWRRIRDAVDSVGSRLFEETPERNPMIVSSGGGDRWLTTLDLAFLTLFTMNMLIEECWEKGVLLVGITKDTSSRDFKNHLIPVCVDQGVWRGSPELADLSSAPNTDRMLLQYNSMEHYRELPTPWALVEYDSAFRMIVPEYKKRRKGYVSGAIRNRINYERLFLKSYIQLAEAKSDPRLRSNVLFIDRISYPEYDYRPDTTLKLTHRYGGADEPLEVILFKGRETRNRVQDLVMAVLEAMSGTSIPEAFGHNVPLFMADKVAKWHYGETRRVIDSTRVWASNNRDLRRHMFYIGSFRERRSRIEQSRRRV